MANPSRPTAEMFRTPSIDDDEAPFLIPQLENNDEEPPKPPALKFTFSLVMVFRVVNFALSIAATVLLSDTWHERATAIFFCILSSIVTAWNTLVIISPLFTGGKGGKKFELIIGNFVCSCARTDSKSTPTGPPFNKRHSYLVNMVDFALCLVMIIPSVLVFTADIYWWDIQRSAGGLCITIVSIQAAIAFLGLFSVFRKVKVCVYPEEDEKAAYVIADSYRDRCPVVASV